MVVCQRLNTFGSTDDLPRDLSKLVINPVQTLYSGVIHGAEHDETTQKPRFSTPSIPLQTLYSGVIDGAEDDERVQIR